MHVCMKKIFPLLICVIFSQVFAACSKDDEGVRMPENIIGIWAASDSHYLEFGEDYTVHNLEIEYQDGESIGLWNNDAYLYEPGYHIVIYLTGTKADVFQVVDLSQDLLTWCWVKQIEIDESINKETIGHIIGDIIKDAQEGFKLNPELYQTFHKISEDEFFSILEKLDIMYPW